MSTHPERDQPDDALIEFLIGLGATAEDVRAAAKVDHLGGLAGDLVLARGSEMNVVDPVSYTHLDVYKRQTNTTTSFSVRHSASTTRTPQRPSG